jgi:hypothetical protein
MILHHHQVTKPSFPNNAFAIDPEMTVNPTDYLDNVTVPSWNSMTEPQEHEPTETSLEGSSAFHDKDSTRISRTGCI